MGYFASSQKDLRSLLSQLNVGLSIPDVFPNSNDTKQCLHKKTNIACRARKESRLTERDPVRWIGGNLAIRREDIRRTKIDELSLLNNGNRSKSSALRGVG